MELEWKRIRVDEVDPSPAMNRRWLRGAFRWLNLLLGLLCLVLSGVASGQDSVPNAQRPRPAGFQRPVLIEFHGPIDLQLTAFFKRRLKQARAAGADLIILDIDSPGGLKTESLQMARQLRDCDWAYTVAMIKHEAISGGALVSIGCDEIQIDPNAKFGDAGEIMFDPEAWAWRLIEPKIESYLSRDARDLAESKGRPADLAEAMVDADLLVYSRTDEQGRLEFAPIRADAALKPDPPWQLVPESGADRFLTLSGQRAVELGMAQGTAGDLPALSAELGFDPEQVIRLKPTMTDHLVFFLNRPWATGLLILLGMIALYVELSAPGVGLGGLVAALCAILFFWSHFLGGTAGWLELILFLSGVAFVAMEVFVIPGLGLPGLLGALLMFASLILASQDFIVPRSAEQWNQLFGSLGLSAGLGIAFLVVAVVITKKMGRLPLVNRFVLQPQVKHPAGSDKGAVDKPAPVAHPTISVGDWGTADSPLRPAGRARFQRRSFDVISDGSFVDRGATVRVIRIAGNVITVAEVEPGPDEPTSPAGVAE